MRLGGSSLRDLGYLRDAESRRASSWDRTGGNDDRLHIKPGETATLFEWDLSECIEDQWGCVKSQPLPPGTYTIRGAFYSFPDAESTAIAEATIQVIDK